MTGLCYSSCSNLPPASPRNSATAPRLITSPSLSFSSFHILVYMYLGSSSTRMELKRSYGAQCLFLDCCTVFVMLHCAYLQDLVNLIVVETEVFHARRQLRLRRWSEVRSGAGIVRRDLALGDGPQCVHQRRWNVIECMFVLLFCGIRRHFVLQHSECFRE